MRRATLPRRWSVVRVMGVMALLMGAACVEPPIEPATYEGFIEGTYLLGSSCDPAKQVDILFVIDNSSSMAEEQAALAASFESFINVLERPERTADYRIGVTTTDNGNPWCPDTTPEAGALRLRSCRSRLQEFVSDDDAHLVPGHLRAVTVEGHRLPGSAVAPRRGDRGAADPSCSGRHDRTLPQAATSLL
jgi:hypothetical protein